MDVANTELQLRRLQCDLFNYDLIEIGGLS